MFVFFHIIKIILFENEIILLNSPLQFLNYIEYKNRTSLKSEIIRKKKILVGFSIEGREYEKILHLVELLKFKDTQIFRLKENIPAAIFLKIINLRGMIKKYNKLIIGDYNSYISSELYKLSNQVLMLDDGTNSLNFKKHFNLDKKKLEIFSIFKKNIFNHKKTSFNNFSYLKSFIKKQHIKKYIILLGSADVEKNLITLQGYFNILKKVEKKNPKQKILYFPHPKEKYENYSIYGFKILKTKKNIETFLVFEKFLPNKIIGFNSTAFVTIHSIYGKKIKLRNYSILSNNNFNKRIDKFRSYYNKIPIYFKKKMGISTSVIIIPNT